MMDHPVYLLSSEKAIATNHLSVHVILSQVWGIVVSEQTCRGTSSVGGGILGGEIRAAAFSEAEPSMPFGASTPELGRWLHN